MLHAFGYVIAELARSFLGVVGRVSYQASLVFTLLVQSELNEQPRYVPESICGLLEQPHTENIRRISTQIVRLSFDGFAA
jgi:hypothetical protein